MAALAPIWVVFLVQTPTVNLVFSRLRFRLKCLLLQPKKIEIVAQRKELFFLNISISCKIKILVTTQTFHES